MNNSRIQRFITTVFLGLSLSIVPAIHAADSGLIKDVQEKLIQLGYDPGGADGVAGNKTTTAITRFQRANNQLVNPVITVDLQKDLLNALAMKLYLDSRSDEAGATPTQHVQKAPSPAPIATRATETATTRQVSPEPKSESSFFGGLANFSRRVTGGLPGKRGVQPGRSMSTATIGIRGLGAGDMKTARADFRAFKQLDSYRSSSQQAYRHADDAGLRNRQIDYIEQQGVMDKWFQ